MPERRAHPQAGRQRHVCDQQAAPEQADLAVIAVEVRGPRACRRPSQLTDSVSLMLSGPKRYDYVPKKNRWIYSRDNRSLGDLMKAELSKMLKQDVDLGVDDLPNVHP